MNSVYIQEKYPYSRQDLLLKFKTTNDPILCIKKLKEYGILKTYSKQDLDNLSELSNENTMVVDEEDTSIERYYAFNFVGLVIVNGLLLKCYPKYISSNNQPLDETKQILKVLQKYNTKEQIIKMYVNCNSSDHSFNRLAAIIGLIEDYYENGLYTNTEEIIETNGSGEIYWDKTINETFAILQNQQPYYIELKTRKKQNDEQYFIKKLHECILTTCSKELKSASISDLLGIEELIFTEETLDDFGDKEYILEQIQKEMNIQFNTQKLSLLKMLYLFVENTGTLLEDSCFTLYGTTSFYSIWEKICAKILNNQFDRKLKEEIARQTTPLWFDSDGGMHQGDSLIPDIISIHDSQFIIFDAKYYNIILESDKKMGNNPGVGDVTKQYLYQLALSDYIKKNSFKTVRNCFLMPTDQNEIIKKGYVKINMFEKLGLENIQIRLLPTVEIFNLYLKNEKMEINDLAL